MPQFLHYHLYIYIDFLSSLLQCHGCNFSFLPHLSHSPLFFSLSVSDICSSLPFTVLWSVLIIYLFAHPTPAHVCMCLCSDNKEAGWSKLAIWPNQPTLIKKLPLTHANTYTHTQTHTAAVSYGHWDTSYILLSIPEHLTSPTPHYCAI